MPPPGMPRTKSNCLGQTHRSVHCCSVTCCAVKLVSTSCKVFWLQRNVASYVCFSRGMIHWAIFWGIKTVKTSNRIWQGDFSVFCHNPVVGLCWRVLKLPRNVMLHMLNIKCDSIHSVLWAVVLSVVSKSWLVNTEEYQRSKNVPLFIAVLVLFSTVPNNSVKLVTTVYLIVITSCQWIHCNCCLTS